VRGVVSTHVKSDPSHGFGGLGLTNREDVFSMKVWTKLVASTVDAGFEVTRYLPSTLDVAANRACK
jgi:hypothetical protein